MHEILKRVAPDFINNIRELNRRELKKIMSETVCHCKIRENAEIIAKILDYDIEGKIAEDIVEVVRCEDCVHSIKKDYGGVISYEYLCTLKSSVTHLEEHEANYFCADGDNKNKKGNETNE